MTTPPQNAIFGNGWTCPSNSIPAWPYFAVRIGPTSHEVECLSTDGINCVSGFTDTTACQNYFNTLDPRTVDPLTCGTAHQAVWGSPGYTDPNHWCGAFSIQNNFTSSTTNLQKCMNLNDEFHIMGSNDTSTLPDGVKIMWMNLNCENILPAPCPTPPPCPVSAPCPTPPPCPVSAPCPTPAPCPVCDSPPPCPHVDCPASAPCPVCNSPPPCPHADCPASAPCSEKTYKISTITFIVLCILCCLTAIYYSSKSK